MKNGNLYEVQYRSVAKKVDDNGNPDFAPGLPAKKWVAAESQLAAETVIGQYAETDTAKSEVISISMFRPNILIEGVDGMAPGADATATERSEFDSVVSPETQYGLEAGGGSKRADELKAGDVLADGFVVLSVENKGEQGVLIRKIIPNSTEKAPEQTGETPEEGGVTQGAIGSNNMKAKSGSDSEEG